MCLAIPGELVSVHERDGLRFGKVEFGGIAREVCLEYQPNAAVGDFVLVHVGFAIATVDRDEAARQWEVLRELGETRALAGEEGGEGGDQGSRPGGRAERGTSGEVE